MLNADFLTRRVIALYKVFILCGIRQKTRRRRSSCFLCESFENCKLFGLALEQLCLFLNSHSIKIIKCKSKIDHNWKDTWKHSKISKSWSTVRVWHTMTLVSVRQKKRQFPGCTMEPRSTRMKQVVNLQATPTQLTFQSHSAPWLRRWSERWPKNWPWRQLCGRCYVWTQILIDSEAEVNLVDLKHISIIPCLQGLQPENIKTC